MIENAAVVNSRYYEALNSTEGERSAIPIGSLYQWLRTHQTEREIMGALARYLFENSAVAGYIIRQIRKYSVPCIPQASTIDSDYNDAIERIWKDFATTASFHNVGDFYTLQKLVCMALDLEGEIGSLLVEVDGALKVQLIHQSSIRRENENKRIIDGIQYDNLDRIQGYWGKQKDGTFRFYDLNYFQLIFDQEDHRNFRGISPLRRGANEIRDARDILNFEKKGVKIASALAATIKTPGGAHPNEDDWGDSKEDLSDEELSTLSEFEKGIGLAKMIGGEFPIMPEGHELDPINFNRPSSTFGGFLDCLLGLFAEGVDIPAAFFLDTKLTSPNQRAVIGKAQKKFDDRKALICKWTTWIWRRVINEAINRGEIPMIDKWDQPTFQTPAKASIDLGRQSQQEHNDIKNLLTSRRTVYGNRGEDWNVELSQIFIEDDFILKKVEELHEKHPLIPLETLLKRYGFEQVKNVSNDQ